MVKSYPIIYVIGAIIALVIIGMSVLLMIKAFRRAKKIGMNKKILTETIKNSAIFSIVPSIPIVIGVGIMMQYIGLAIPWIRLTVVGALQYEISALYVAGATEAGATPAALASAVVVMTISVLGGCVFNAVLYKKYQYKLMEIQQKDSRKMDAITGALLGGMLAGIISSIVVGGAFGVGHPVTDTGGITTYGEITLITVAASILIMGLCGVLLLVFKQKWVESYALPLSMLGALAIAFAFVPVFA